VPRDGFWELAICSRFPIVASRALPIGRIRSDPAGARSALACTLDVHGEHLDLVGLHTSSKLWFLAPVRHLLALRRRLDEHDLRPTIVAGDFNFWGPPVEVLMPGFRRTVRGRTYPAHRPHSQIDHVLVRSDMEVLDAEVLPETPSDHRPIRTRLRWSGRVT
jgi:endonuclease/exonuclease/phosphatase (EEP) superfamily protein YafD